MRCLLKKLMEINPDKNAQQLYDTTLNRESVDTHYLQVKLYLNYFRKIFFVLIQSASFNDAVNSSKKKASVVD